MQFVFALTLFASATLLFLVQPMFARMALPLLGGTPAVWNTCMVFYQAALLWGYVYAHLSITQLGARRQALFHLLLLAVPVLVLPIGIAADWRPPTQSNPIPALLGLLATSVGLPFFMVSATGPMLQAWFAATGHRSARDPYFLYAASNLGSMLGLLGYPLLVEPFLTLAQQARLWSIGYGVLCGLIALCSLLLWCARPQAIVEATLTGPQTGVLRPTVRERLRWLALAMVPSSLMLGVTTFISTDVASVPMLWVIPLALYLLSFVLVFARRTLLPHRWMLHLQPLLILLLAVWFYVNNSKMHWLLVGLHLAVFFVTAMVCHGELARTRPAARYLTEFYLWMSLGGVVGGLINAIVAPLVFPAVLEYPLMLVVACALRPSLSDRASARGARQRDLLLPALLAAVIVGAASLLHQYEYNFNLYWRLGLLGSATLVVLAFSPRAIRFALGVAAILFTAHLLGADKQVLLHQTRSFFGVIRVKSDGNYHSLEHGTTRHGMQCVIDGRRSEALTYYYNNGPLGQIFTDRAKGESLREVAAIGLGAGTVAAYGLPDMRITFYEIDPAMVRVAKDPKLFSYLTDSGAKEIAYVLGDARLMLAQAPQHGYDLIVLDAFSSDAIPMHLLTREALQLYLEKLAPAGLLMVHVSNRHLALEPIVGRLADDAGLIALEQSDDASQADEDRGKLSSTWVLVARNELALGDYLDDARWTRIETPSGTPLWTDDFSNILSALRTRGE